jgi:hypothetical protein
MLAKMSWNTICTAAFAKLLWNRSMELATNRSNFDDVRAICAIAKYNFQPQRPLQKWFQKRWMVVWAVFEISVLHENNFTARAREATAQSRPFCRD